MRFAAIAVGVFVLLGPTVARAQSAPDESTVGAAIQKGVAWLKKRGHSFGKQGDRGNTRELVLLTLIHAGVKEGDPFYAKALAEMLKEEPEHTYRTALRAMVLEEVDRLKYQPQLYACAEFFCDNQSKSGYWGYGSKVEHTPFPGRRFVATGSRNRSSSRGGVMVFGPGKSVADKEKPKVVQRVPVQQKKTGKGNDNSNSQYAALGLRACHDGGIIFPREVIDKAITWWIESQEKADKKNRDVATGRLAGTPRGWGYKKNTSEHGGVRGSMTAGAIGALSILHYMRGSDWKRDQNLVDGCAWLAVNFKLDENPKHGKGWHYYYLYGLERAGQLYGTPEFGKHQWYAEGARYLIDHQLKSGSWKSGEGDKNKNGDLKDTCFAILFLRRATRELVQSVDRGR